MAKAKKAKKPEKTEKVKVDHTPLNEVLTELQAVIGGGGDVASRQATYDKLKAYSDQVQK